MFPLIKNTAPVADATAGPDLTVNPIVGMVPAAPPPTLTVPRFTTAVPSVARLKINLGGITVESTPPFDLTLAELTVTPVTELVLDVYDIDTLLLADDDSITPKRQ